MPKIKITQVKRPIGRKSYQQKILISLGLNTLNRNKIHDDSSAI